MANEIRWWWRRLKCWLTGGHTFADSNLKSEHSPSFRVTFFYNKCLKCGKHKVFAVNDDALYCGSPLADERIKVDFDGK